MKNQINEFTQSVTIGSKDVYVLNKKFFCSGELSASPHPKVYLKISETEKKEGKTSCPYCNQKFIFKDK